MKDVIMEFLFFAIPHYGPFRFEKDSWAVPSLIVILSCVVFYGLAFHFHFKYKNIGNLKKRIYVALFLSGPILIGLWLLALGKQYQALHPGFPFAGFGFLSFPIWMSVGLYIFFPFNFHSREQRKVRRPKAQPSHAADANSGRR